MTFLRKLTSYDDTLDFRKGWRIGFIISGVLIVASIISLSTQGLKLGVDFKGGTVWEITNSKATVDQVRTVLKPLGEGDATIQIVGTNNLRVEAGPKSATERDKTTAVLAAVSKAPLSNVSISTVGPSWGKDVSGKAIKALIFFFIAIALYISIRLEWRMAVGAIVAVIHDVFISVGVYSIFQFEVTPGTVIAFLTILGYSLYDTIVVYDKVADNAKRLSGGGRYSYTGVMNLSLNQVIMRSLNTTLAAVLPVLSILFIGAGIMGAVALEEFGLALLVGLLVGAYSSVFIAAPIVAALKEREPKWRQIRERLNARGLTGIGPAPHLAGAAGTGDDVLVSSGATTSSGPRAGGAIVSGDDAPAGSTPKPSGSAAQQRVSTNIPPRPRKKGKKR